MAMTSQTKDATKRAEFGRKQRKSDAFNPFSAHAQTTIIQIEIEKSALLFWGWIGFGVAILSFYFPILPGLGFLGIGIWAILQSSPHLGSKIAAHRHIAPHLAKWHETRDMPKNVKIAVSILLAAGALFIALNEDRLALVAFGLFICLPVASALWGKPFGQKFTDDL